MIAIIQATIKFVSIYTCAVCYFTAVGTTARREFSGLTTQELKEFVDAQQPRSHDMPIGWSYDGRFTCPKCNGVTVR